ncbi:MAG: hypothetical protein ACSHWZ_14265 [Sulfitobacter sp.]
MRRLAAGLLALALAACGAQGNAPRAAHPNQQPSVTEPGIHISGHANIGVVRNF